jgi:IS5 family transposase
LAPAIQRITRRTGRPPRAVTADRGYGFATVERDLHALGVRSVAIGWNRTELTGVTGARTWCGHGVFAHDLVKISALAA